MRLITLPAGRRGKWAVVVFWLLLVGAVSPFAAKLTSVQKNDASSYLPGKAESTRALELQRQLPSGRTLPVIIVYARDAGITPADAGQAAADRSKIDAARLVAEPLPPVVPAQDGRALLLAVPLPGGGDAIALGKQVEDIRATVGAGGDGLVVKVTGPGGFLVDSVKAFEGIDTTLLFATVGVVALLLLLTYRSPVLWLIPLIGVGMADQLAQGAVYGLARHAGLVVSGQSAGILTVLVFGAGTDYALLLIARYREELRRHEDKHEAMAFALRRAAPALLASAATVIIGLLCLLVAALNSDRGLGPVGAIGVACSLAAMLTLLPALLVIFGRRLFWPFIPRFGTHVAEGAGVWARVGQLIARRPRVTWVATSLVLGVLALGLFDLKLGLSQTEAFQQPNDSVQGQQLLERSFPAGTGAPATVIAQASAIDDVRAAAAATPGVVSVSPPLVAGNLAQVDATLEGAPDSKAAYGAIDRLRAAVHAVPGADAVVGGSTATNLDVSRAATRDRQVIIPLVLLVVLVILGVLLRAVVAPLVLIATVILSYLAALGASAVIFDAVFGFAGSDTSFPLFAFIFLVALGIDYNIFLMSRVREEAAVVGTRRGMLRGLAVTGGVITSAGIVLAGTFSVLGVLPLVALAEVGFVVAFGVLLDTLVVRSVLVPASPWTSGRGSGGRARWRGRRTVTSTPSWRCGTWSRPGAPPPDLWTTRRADRRRCLASYPGNRRRSRWGRRGRSPGTAWSGCSASALPVRCGGRTSWPAVTWWRSSGSARVRPGRATCPRRSGWAGRRRCWPPSGIRTCCRYAASSLSTTASCWSSTTPPAAVWIGCSGRAAG